MELLFRFLLGLTIEFQDGSRAERRRESGAQSVLAPPARARERLREEL
jgi:hypothetical protein